MGKTKKGKPKPHKSNPTGLVSMRELEMDENGSTGGPINSIIEQLQSVNSDEKMCGLQALSTLCQREYNIQSIVDSEIVRIAAPMLVDHDLNVRHATAGALRNFSAVSVEICENLVEQDVFTPLLILLNQYVNNDWLPTKEKRSDTLDQKSDTFLQAVNIVWNLCESTSVALEYFNQSQLLQNFVRCLNYELFGMDIAISVGQCLLVISEDNAAAWKVLIDHNSDFQNLLKIDGDFQIVMLRTLVAGIISNVPALLMQNLKLVIEALSKTIEINHRTVLNEITSKLPLNETDGPQIEVIDEEMAEESEADASFRRFKEECPTELDNEIKNVAYLLSAQRISSEVLSNICTPEDDEGMDEDFDDKSDAESVHDYDVTQQAQQNGNQVGGDKIPVEIAEAIKAHQVVEKLWARAQLLPENVQQILAECEKNLWKRQNSLRVSSLLCLHNLCNCMTIEDLGGATAIYNVWLDLGQQIFQTHQDPATVEAATSLMRATLDHLKKSPELFEQVSENDLHLILDGVKDCEKSEVRANWLRMLGTLGCLLKENLVKKIVEFVLDATLKENDVWTLSESLDSFMDIFSDNDWNQIVDDLNVILKSRELEKILKTKMRQQKRELGDRYSSILTVRTNLTRFCKYLENQQKIYMRSKN
ncbi:CLUMA_CG000544, isoform A [Clunio marinus]|uniref:CLUMA_CG000544, isoform A n=1 Tax=Clunio marinus TaxID=568069 RepID=A0A1J1HFG5_9DIPT|nr:CLUMA_CG000544, isoform A [Clunio marinus]